MKKINETNNDMFVEISEEVLLSVDGGCTQEQEPPKPVGRYDGHCAAGNNCLWTK